MTRQPVERDERSIAVDNEAGNRGYKVISWLLVIDLGVHGFRPEWTLLNGFPIDLLLIGLGGWLGWASVAFRRQILSRKWAVMMAACFVVAAVVAAVIQALR